MKTFITHFVKFLKVLIDFEEADFDRNKRSAKMTTSGFYSSMHSLK